MKDMDIVEAAPLSMLTRFYIYGLHGYATEICFTAGWEFVVNYNWKFPGNSSVWALLIYGVSAIVIEQMYLKLNQKLPLPVRVFIYTLWGYAWEFACGYVLKQFNACPWDYSPFHGDFMGLVTLEYAPAWYMANLILEQILIPYTMRLCWKDVRHCKAEANANGEVKQKNI